MRYSVREILLCTMGVCMRYRVGGNITVYIDVCVRYTVKEYYFVH